VLGRVSLNNRANIPEKREGDSPSNCGSMGGVGLRIERGVAYKQRQSQDTGSPFGHCEVLAHAEENEKGGERHTRS